MIAYNLICGDWYVVQLFLFEFSAEFFSFNSERPTFFWYGIEKKSHDDFQALISLKITKGVVRGTSTLQMFM